MEICGWIRSSPRVLHGHCSIRTTQTVLSPLPLVSVHNKQLSSQTTTLMYLGFISSIPLRISVTRHGSCAADRKPRNAVCRPCRRICAPKAVLDLVEPSTALSLLAVEEDITRRVFLGGIGIILSGIVGVFIVFLLIKDRLEEVSASHIAINTFTTPCSTFLVDMANCLHRHYLYLWRILTVIHVYPA